MTDIRLECHGNHANSASPRDCPGLSARRRVCDSATAGDPRLTGSWAHEVLEQEPEGRRPVTGRQYPGEHATGQAWHDSEDGVRTVQTQPGK